MHSIVIIDDHPMMRKALASYLTESGTFSVVGEAASLTGAKELLEKFEEPPELGLLDIELRGENGLELIRYLRERQARKIGKKTLPSDIILHPMFLVYSMFEDSFRVQSAIQMGARGYISKTADEEEIGKALDQILRGEVYIEEHLGLKSSRMPDIYNSLTKKERIILDLVKKRFDNRDIARELSIKLRTVENYMSRIYAKTGAGSRGELYRI